MSKLKLFLAVILILTGVLIILFWPLPELTDLNQKVETTKIYDRHGELLWEVYAEDRGRQTSVDLDEISPYLIKAMIATEDQRFFSNWGIDFRAIMRAIWQNVREGGVVSGASTITQQLVQNLAKKKYSRTFSHKIIESIWAIRLSFFYSKEDILEKYLNTIYFGNLAYGVEAASQTYFGKSAQDLDLAESSFLAGLPQSPVAYDPYRFIDKAKNRQAVVLTRMLKEGYIEEVGYRAALNQEIKIYSSYIRGEAPHFVQFILPQLEDLIGANELKNGGYRIYTTLDLALQSEVEHIIKEHLKALVKFNVTNASVIVIEPFTGAIIVMLGSRDYYSSEINGKYNLATARRQSGSSFKPFIYLAGIQAGLGPVTIINDTETRFFTAEGLPYTPQNFDLKTHGLVTLRTALGNSLNIPAVKVLNEVGLNNTLRLLKELGFNNLPEADQVGLSLALGSASIQPLEMAQAYGIIANQGQKIDLNFIQKIEMLDNHNEWSKYQFNRSKTTSVISSEQAYILTDILSDNKSRLMTFGEDNILKTNYPSAVKTGTTRNFKDSWTAGFSPDYVVVTWVGNNDNSPMRSITGSTGAAPIWRKVMDILHQGKKIRGFSKPAGIIEREFCFQEKCRMESYIINQEYRKSIEQSVQKKVFNESLGELGQAEIRLRELITKPFDKSVYQIDPHTARARQNLTLRSDYHVKWYVDGQYLGEGEKIVWPLIVGQHQIIAELGDQQEQITIYVNE